MIVSTKEQVFEIMGKYYGNAHWRFAVRNGYSVELHHPNGIKNDFYNFVEVSKTLHDAIHTFFG